MIFKLLNFVFIFGITLYSGSSSVLFSILLFYLLGNGLVYFFSQNAHIQRHDLLSVFNIAFFVYFLFALTAYLGFHGDNGVFRFIDEEGFFAIGNSLGTRGSIKLIFKDCFIDRIHLENEGVHFLSGSIAYSANTFFDGNSVLLQSLYVSFFALIINLFVYKTLSFYVNRLLAYKYTIYYLLFSAILFYSPWLLRDIHLALLFVIATYIVHLKFSVKNLVFLVILQIITLEFRFENGVAFSIFPLIYVYGTEKYSKYRNLSLFMLSAVLVSIVVFYTTTILNSISSITNTLDRYTIFTVESAEASQGLGRLIYRLPPGISHVFRVLFSQILPFPPLRGISYADNFAQGVVTIVISLSAVFWGYVVYVSIKSYKYFVNLSFLTKLLVLFMIIFLFLNTSNMNPRRLIVVYPIIYLFFVYVTSRLSAIQNRRNFKTYTLIYALLLAVYTIATI